MPRKASDSNRSPKAIRTRSPTRFRTRCSTPSRPQDKRARGLRNLVKTGAAIVAGEVTTRVGRHRVAGAQGHHQRHRLRQFRRRLRRATCAIINMLGKAVAGHRRRRTHRRRPRSRKNRARRPGPDVRLRLQRSPGIHAGADVLQPPPGRAAGQGAQERQAEVAAPGREVAGHPALRRNSGDRRLDAVVLSTQHDPDIKQKDLSRPCASTSSPVLPKKWLDALPKNKVHINPTGIFVIGGPVGDCGLTGRKIIVDSYGGMARHGGGAFSGKDPSKVDRSAAYAARYVARTSSPPAWPTSAKCRSATPSAWPNRPRSRSPPSAPARSGRDRSRS